MPFHPIETYRLYQQVAHQIREMIHAGEYHAGDRLPPERDLAKRLGVSRPTIREAMIALEIDGLIEIRVGAGIFISPEAGSRQPALLPTIDAGPSPFDLLAARRLLECEIVAQAAEQATPAQLAAIGQTITTMERSTGDRAVWQQADRQFHNRIAAATGNDVLVSLVDGLWAGVFQPIFHGLSQRTGLPQNQTMTLIEHRAIYDELRRRDPEGARRAMTAHLAHVASILADADLSRQESGHPETGHAGGEPAPPAARRRLRRTAVVSDGLK